MFLLQRQKRIVSCVFLQFFFSSGQRILDLSLNVKLSYIPTLFPHTSLCEQLDFSVPRSICMSCHGSLTTQSRSLSSQEQLPLLDPELVQHAFSWPGSCCEPSFAKGASGGREMERENDCAERNLLLVSKFVLTTNQSLVGFTSLGPSPVEMACPFLV